MGGAQLDRDNPWPGLESFEENASDYFHGREAEADDLLRRVIDAPLTVLFGKSGLGKTSLLKAGLFPRLRARHFFPVHVRLDIRPDAPELGDQLRDSLLAALTRERVDAPPFHPGETLWEYLHRADLELWSEQNYPLTPVFVLDQFEEVFTLGERLPESVENCKIDLGDLAENRIPAALANRIATRDLDLRRMPYKLVVTLREDFLPHLEAWRAAVPSLGRVRVRLLPMRPDQALSAVYDTAPHLMDEALARRIVAFVAAAQGDSGEVEPALLSLFCRGLNERRKKQNADRFDAQLLEGAQQSIIADYYRSCVEGLPDSVSRFIESDLITEKGFRNSYAKDDAVPAILAEEQLERLINRRLLRVEERYGTARIELTHDLLTRAVMADRDRRRVEEEKAALAAQARTQRRRLMVMGFVALVCLVFAGVAAWQRREALKAKKVAEALKANAESAKTTAVNAFERARQESLKARLAEIAARDALSEAQTQAQLAKESAAREQVARGSSEARRTETEARLVFGETGDALAKAALLSVASMRFTRTVDGQISLTKYLGLLPKAPLWRSPVAQPTTAGGHAERALAVSPDGKQIAVIGESGPVQFLDANTGKHLRSFDVTRYGGMTTLAFSPNGAILAVGCGHQACIVDAASGKLLKRLPSDEGNHGQGVWSASFSPDGQQLAMASYNSGDALVYDVATWQTAATIRTGALSVFSVVFSSGGEWLATGTSSGLQLWRAGHYEAPAAHAGKEIIQSIAFLPGRPGLIAAGETRLQTWAIEGAGNTMRLDAVASKPIGAHVVLPVSWHEEPCFAAAASDAVHLFCGLSLDEEFSRIPVSSVAAGMSPDGHQLFNEQTDGVLAAWPFDAGPDAHRIRLDAPIRSMTTGRGWLASGADNGQVAIVDFDSWKKRRGLHLPTTDPASTVTASSDGRRLAVVQGSSLHVFDSGDWHEVASRTYEHAVAGAAFDSADRLVAVTETDVFVWPAGASRERVRLPVEGNMESLKVSPNGALLAVTTHFPSGHDTGVNLRRVFDLASGNEIGWEYRSGSGYISQQFARDEAARRQRALAGGDDALVHAASSWRALEFHEPREQTSADGLWSVRTSGSLATLRDAATDREIARFDHGGDITSVRFVPADAPRWLVTAGDDGTIAVWPLGTEELLHEACARLRAIFDPAALRKLAADAHVANGCDETPRRAQ